MLATESSAVASSLSPAQTAVFSAGWQQVVAPAEPFLEAVGLRLTEQIQAFDPAIGSYVQYALKGQGKQLRPVLVALSAGATGSVQDSHILVAVIVEMVHLATLVHDDVMDEAVMRRGRPTLAANWGNEISVLVGDCLFAHALRLAASFPTPEVCRAVAAATNTVCSGEILQTQRQRNFEFSRAEYFKVLQMKTGELFALSCSLGAYLSGADVLARNALRQYGLALGTAYQVFDDCVDLFGTETIAGKSLGTDLAKGKLTLPILLLLERVEPGQRAIVQDLVEQWKPQHVPQMMKWLQQHQTLEGSKEVVHEYLRAARQALDPLPPSESKRSLLGLSDYLAQQTAGLGDSQ